MASSYILIGIILGPFGIEGAIRFKSFSESEDTLRSYKMLYDLEGSEEFKIKRIKPDKKDTFIIYFEHITNRTEAEKFKNLKLYIKPTQLNIPKEDEYYHHDLIGLEVFNEDNKKIGIIKKITDYGNGDLLEVIEYNTTILLLIPFNSHFVTEIQLENHRIIVDNAYIQSLSNLNGASG